MRGKDTLRRSARERREFLKALAALAFLAFAAVIGYQAASNLRSSNLAGGYSPRWQPLGPGVQLAACAGILYFSVVTLWRYFRRKPEKKHARHKIIDPLSPPKDKS